MNIGMLEELTGPVDPIEIDPGIRKMVAILNSKGLATTLSCEGHYDRVGPRGFNAYVVIDPRAFKAYMSAYSFKMERFLAENPIVSLDISYRGSGDSDGGVHVRAAPTLVFPAPPLGWCEGVVADRDAAKKEWLAAAEHDAEKFL